VQWQHNNKTWGNNSAEEPELSADDKHFGWLHIEAIVWLQDILLAMDVCVSSRGHEHYSNAIVLVPSPFSLLYVAGVQRGETIQ
jgi:hypothetical protein